MWGESSEEEERIFLVGFGPRVRRYGTTTTPTAHTHFNYSHLLYHTVQPTDTLQGLALKYNSSMPEIRRLNKLWSNDSLYLKDMVVIPVMGEGSPSSSYQSPPAPSNGGSPSFSDFRRRSSTRSQIRNTPQEEESRTSVSDILSRIDATIKSTAQNVRKLEKSSTVERVMGEETSESSARAKESPKAEEPRSVRAQLGLDDLDTAAVRSQSNRFFSSLQKLQQSYQT